MIAVGRMRARENFRTHRTESRYRRTLHFEWLERREMLHAGVDWPTLSAAEGEPSPMPDFSLVDQNTTSPTYGQNVSPRDYLEQATGWYFGHAL